MFNFVKTQLNPRVDYALRGIDSALKTVSTPDRIENLLSAREQIGHEALEKKAGLNGN